MLAINSGKGSLYKGKHLDEINLSDIDMDSDPEEETLDKEENSTQEDVTQGSISLTDCNVINNKSKFLI